MLSLGRVTPRALPTLFAAFLVSTLGVAGAASATSVYGTSAQAELTGSRDVDGGGLSGFGQWSTEFTVGWEITDNGSSWHYKYTFTGLSGSGQEKGISHMVLDLSDDCFAPFDPLCVYDIVGDPDPELIEFGDKDGITGAIKFDYGGGEGMIYEFDSNRAPVYGHLAVKDGGGPDTCADVPTSVAVVCSVGLLDPAAAIQMDTLNFVARPNGLVPEPSIATLLGIALLGLAVRHRT